MLISLTVPYILRSFTASLQPFAKRSMSDLAPSNIPASPVPSRNASANNLVVDLSSAEEMATSIQDFYDSIEEELRKDKSWSGTTPRRRSVDGEKVEIGEKDTKEEVADLEDPLDDRIREALEKVEGCMTSIFYDQCVPLQCCSIRDTNDALTTDCSFQQGRMMPRMTRRSRTVSLL